MVADKDNPGNVLLGYQECLTFNLLTLPYDTVIYHFHDQEYLTEFKKEKQTNVQFQKILSKFPIFMTILECMGSQTACWMWLTCPTCEGFKSTEEHS